MSTYVIGDVHGCFDQFIRLLEKINYDTSNDQIILTGDLINRGPKSLAVFAGKIDYPKYRFFVS